MEEKTPAENKVDKVDLKTDLAKNINVEEPILKENPNRFVLFPIH